MSLLQSQLRRTESAFPASAALQRAAAGVLGRVACNVFSCCMVFGCSFDATPAMGGRTDSMSAAGWKPPGAASAGASGASLAQDGAVDGTMSARSGSAGSGTGSMRPGAANPGTMAPHPGSGRQDPDEELDAGAMPTKDAATPPTMQPQADASMSTSMPTSSVRCKPGVYTGTFSGSLQLVGLSLSPVTGTVRAELVADATAEHLGLRDGHVAGVDQDGNRLTCGLTGRINCADFQFVEGRLADGIFHNLEANSDTAFTGSAQAMYSQEPHSIIGTWKVEATDTSLLGGRGTWTLVFSE